LLHSRRFVWRIHISLFCCSMDELQVNYTNNDTNMPSTGLMLTTDVIINKVIKMMILVFPVTIRISKLFMLQICHNNIPCHILFIYVVILYNFISQNL
jgi:hypothetical protein